MKKTIYVAIPLTHVSTEEERNEIRTILNWIKTDFPETELLQWAFDPESWTPKGVPNIYDFDRRQIMKADLAIFFYLRSEGSDGRGGEGVLRTELCPERPIIAAKLPGVRMSRFVEDCLKLKGVPVTEFRTLDELTPLVREALKGVDDVMSRYSFEETDSTT